MGIIHEETEFIAGDCPVTLTVVEREPGECREPWRCIKIETDHFERLTPPELRALGRWLVKEGRRIGKEYKSNGAPRVSPNAEVTGGPLAARPVE